ncbi:magnesium/cobalt transporter CorA [Daejeonella oryzae]|uniref:magnesium/cobalt transporter CorA n=1 Tax=Daejeonella oryzae TaxID=1122943 RepID=UPI0004279350|nr:magnesium/cobalt transporter CorA [Daejeonella oryzae]
MGKIKRIKLKDNKHRSVPGTHPGAFTIKAGALEPKITVHSYDDLKYDKKVVLNVKELETLLDSKPDSTHWIDIKGLGDLSLMHFIEKRFNIHKLIVEDIVNTHQRPKIDENRSYIFAVSRMLYINQNLEIENEQISFILTENVLVSFQENYIDCFDPVVNWLNSAKGNIRTGGTSYMLYALMDVIVDNYFLLLYKIGEELETLEDLLYRRPDKSLMYQVQSLKRAIIMIRRSAWPERDKINDMLRSDSKLITANTKTFLKDTYDHTMQVMDLVESNKEMTTSLIEINLAFQSNRMNEIMKVLTIISSIFIPLTFIAGIYGMNFAYQDPVTGEILNKNMPELYAEHGYVYTMAIMFLIAIIQLIFFWRKGWLFN